MRFPSPGVTSKSLGWTACAVLKRVDFENIGETGFNAWVCSAEKKEAYKSGELCDHMEGTALHAEHMLAARDRAEAAAMEKGEDFDLWPFHLEFKIPIKGLKAVRNLIFPKPIPRESAREDTEWACPTQCPSVCLVSRDQIGFACAAASSPSKATRSSVPFVQRLQPPQLCPEMQYIYIYIYIYICVGYTIPPLTLADMLHVTL